MSVSFKSPRQRRWLASLLVVAYALRALIPGGFMPGSGGALALQICPVGFPAALLSHANEHEGHHSSGSPAHDHNSWMSGHCAFAAAAAGAPPPCISAVVVVVHPRGSQPRIATVPASLDFRFHIAQPRGPPSLS